MTNTNKPISPIFETKEEFNPSDIEILQDEEPKVVESTQFTHQQLHDALMYAQDMLERSSVDFLVVGEIAKTMTKGELYEFTGDKVSLVVRKSSWHTAGNSMFRGLVKDCHMEIHGKHPIMKFSYHVPRTDIKVPIEIHIIEDNYRFLKYPDKRFYHLTEFYLPNPFKDYEKEDLNW